MKVQFIAERISIVYLAQLKQMQDPKKSQIEKCSNKICRNFPRDCSYKLLKIEKSVKGVMS